MSLAKQKQELFPYTVYLSLIRCRRGLLREQAGKGGRLSKVLLERSDDKVLLCQLYCLLA